MRHDLLAPKPLPVVSFPVSLNHVCFIRFAACSGDAYAAVPSVIPLLVSFVRPGALFVMIAFKSSPRYHPEWDTRLSRTSGYLSLADHEQAPAAVYVTCVLKSVRKTESLD